MTQRLTANTSFRQQAARSARGCLLAVLASLVISTVAARRAEAQPTWEYSPYIVHVWVALGSQAELTDDHFRRIAATIRDQADLIAGATWDTRIRRCPEIFRTTVANRIEGLTVEAILAEEQRLADMGTPEAEAESDYLRRLIRDDDKLFLLAVNAEPDGFRVQARELDCRTRMWRPVIQRHVNQTMLLADTCFAAIAAAFSAVVRIEDYRGKEADVRVRAGGLVIDPANPSHIPPKAVLLPIIRRNDRIGEPMENGIQIAPWTFMTVRDRTNNVLHCDVHSGFRSALGTRASSRTIKLALAVDPTGETTALKLESRDKDPVPLGGYEIYSKDPDTEESELIGTTDWRGVLEVERGEKLLQVLYVRNGGRLLARLPMVAGLEPQQTMEVYNDDRRLQAEGFVKGVQNKVMDLIAQRELYIARFRRHLQKSEFDEAKIVLEEFRNLQTRTDLSIELERAAQRIKSSDQRIQTKIDELFTNTRQLLTRFLDPTTANQLSQELNEARLSATGGAGSATTGG